MLANPIRLLAMQKARRGARMDCLLRIYEQCSVRSVYARL